MTIALENVVAVVTGAAGGIGRATVAALKAAGASVVAAIVSIRSSGFSANPLSTQRLKPALSSGVTTKPG